MYSIVLALVLGLALTGILAVVSTLLRSGPRLVRFVEIACWVIVGVAIVWTLATIGLSLVGGTTTVEVPLAVHAPAVKVPGLIEKTVSTLREVSPTIFCSVPRIPSFVLMHSAGWYRTPWTSTQWVSSGPEGAGCTRRSVSAIAGEF